MDDIIELYFEKKEEWEAYSQEVHKRIFQILKETEIKFNIKNRVKTVESLNEKKLRLLENNDPEKIKDLFGFRIIVPFLEDVDSVVEELDKIFEIVEVDRKSEDLSFREFAYDSVHLEVKDPQSHLKLPDFCDERIEIQIRTTLQDAWAEVEHELIYKSDVQFPDSNAIRKKIAALNANLTLSDIIFQEIKDGQKELKTWGVERFNELYKRARGVSHGSLPKYKKEYSKNLEVEPIEKPEGFDKDKLSHLLQTALQAHNEERYAEATFHYGQALKLNPALPIRAILYNHRGLAYFMMNKERKALRDFDQAARCDPKNAPVLVHKGLVLRRFGLTDEALFNFNKALDIQPKQADTHFLKAQTFLELGEMENAMESIEKAISLKPEESKYHFLKKDIEAAES